MKRHVIPLLITLLAGTLCSAQTTSPEVFTTAGGSGTSASAKLNWTIGEAVTETAVGNTETLTQGFQQPEVNFSTALPDNDPTWSVSVFPNPSSTQVEVTLASAPEDATVTLLSLDGKELLRERMTGTRLLIDVSHLAAGQYLLDLRDPATGRSAQFNLHKTN